MKKFLLLILILTSYPVFASCPIDGITDACVAEFSPVPSLNPIPANRNPEGFSRPFQGVVNTTPISKEIGPSNKTREFGPTTQDYNYNSSCQFGICRTTGTPKSITGEN